MPTSIISAVLQSKEASIDKDGVQRYVHAYLVEASNGDASESLVGSVLPAWGTVHPDDPIAIAKGVSARQRKDDLCFWDCEVSYDTAQDRTDAGTRTPGSLSPPTERGRNGNQTAPNSRPWVYKWGSRHRTVHLMQDRSATPKDVVNAAGQPFDGGLEVPVVNPTLHITGYKLIGAVVPGAKIIRFVDKVNDSEWMGFSFGTARCTEYSETTQYEHGMFFWQIDVTVEFQFQGWNPVRVLNAGTRYRLSNTKPLQPILDRQGNPVTSPVPLKADGSGPINAEDAPNYLSFTAYESADFSALI